MYLGQLLGQNAFLSFFQAFFIIFSITKKPAQLRAMRVVGDGASDRD
jgi:hypothetical protein